VGGYGLVVPSATLSLPNFAIPPPPQLLCRGSNLLPPPSHRSPSLLLLLVMSQGVPRNPITRLKRARQPPPPPRLLQHQPSSNFPTRGDSVRSCRTRPKLPLLPLYICVPVLLIVPFPHLGPHPNRRITGNARSLGAARLRIWKSQKGAWDPDLRISTMLVCDSCGLLLVALCILSQRAASHLCRSHLPKKKCGEKYIFFSSEGWLAATSARFARSRSISRTGSGKHGDHVEGVTRGTRTSITRTPPSHATRAPLPELFQRGSHPTCWPLTKLWSQMRHGSLSTQEMDKAAPTTPLPLSPSGKP
ncbi:hypothetical protein B296_00047503, partial [Ensete ventricosum]